MRKCTFRNCNVTTEDWENVCDEHRIFVANIKEAMRLIEEEKAQY